MNATRTTAWYSTILSLLTMAFIFITSAVRMSLTVLAVSVMAFWTASSKLFADSPRISMYLKTL